MKVQDKLVKIIGERGSRRRAVVSACVIAALAVVMFFTAMFAPFRYTSNRDLLHYVEATGRESGEAGQASDDPDETRVAVNVTVHVHQSLFRIFEAVTMLSDADVLSAASTGEIADAERYGKARSRFDELNNTFNDIYTETVIEMAEKDVSPLDAEFAERLGEKLSDMNLIAVDLLGAAFESDDFGSYDTARAGVILALFNAIIALMIFVTAVLAVIFAVLYALGRFFDTGLLFLRLFTYISAAGLLFALFNPILIPTAAPLALACVAMTVFFACALVRALADSVIDSAFIKNAVIAAAVPVAMLTLAAMPSLTVYYRVIGYFPGSVGTVVYSRIRVAMLTGLQLPSGAITVATVLGLFVGVLSTLAAVSVIERLYKGEGSDAYIFGLLAATVAVGLALIISVAGITVNIQADGYHMRYIAGPCWYINLVFMFCAAVADIVYNTFFKKPEPAPETDALESDGVMEESAETVE